MTNWELWLRWSWRDLRARWLQVLAIALIIALGTGVFAGLGGQKTWRMDSFNLSYDRLNMYDLRVRLADGSYVDQVALLDSLRDVDGIKTLEPRLVTPTLVDASTEDETIIVRGRLVGMDLTNGGPQVNKLYVDQDNGRVLTEADTGTLAAVMEYKFAREHDLKPGHPIRISGDVALNVVGAGHSPEYFLVIPETGNYLGMGSFAVIFMSLDTVQQLSGHEGLVNEIAILTNDGANLDQVQAEVETRLAAAFPDVGITLNTREEDIVRQAMFDDAENDQVTWDMVALLFLFGAALGAFNLAGRIVESQRRQIGIGMALGVPRGWLAFRPMLVGLQIAILGTIFGLVFGVVLSQLFGSLFKDVAPLPYWDISLYVPGFLRAVALGVLIPFVSTLIPVIRAVRVAPIDAIRSGYLVEKGGGLNWVTKLVPLPGKSFAQMPFHNLLRSPWRSLLTVIGISLAILLMVAFIGFLDSFLATMDRADDAYRYQGRDRVLVSLDFFYPQDNGEITTLASLPAPDGGPLFAEIEPALMVGGKLISSDEEIDIALELHDMQNAIWVPRLIDGSLNGEEPGLILSEKAAEDLGVGVGDRVTTELPLREGPMAFRLERFDLPVVGIHDNPLRPLIYMDMAGAELLGLDGATNLVIGQPAPGIDANAIKKVLLTQPGVASVAGVGESAEQIDKLMDMFVAVLYAVRVIVMFMAFLIAFNSTSINVDERVREISTMFAFGLSIRTVTRMQIHENLVIGVLGTILGVIAGWFALVALLAARVEDQLAEFKFIVTVSTDTLVVSALLGILVVGLTPLLSIRRMANMDIPSTLRVME